MSSLQASSSPCPALLRLLEPLDVSAGVSEPVSGREGVWEARVTAAQPAPSRRGPAGLVLGFRKPRPKELGHCGEAARSPEREQPPPPGSPHLSLGPELRELHRRRREGTAFRGSRLRAAEDPRGCELFLRMAPHTAFRDPLTGRGPGVGGRPGWVCVGPSRAPAPGRGEEVV